MATSRDENISSETPAASNISAPSPSLPPSASFTRLSGDKHFGRLAKYMINAKELTLKSEIAHSNISSIYSGSWNDKSVAIKLAYYTDEIKFYNEINIMATLNECYTPNIITLLGFTHTIGTSSIVMELENRGSLAKHINNNKQARFSWQLIYKILIEMARALDYMHSLDIAHGDFKLDNVLLRENDNIISAILCDFGGARKLDNDIEYYQGTPGFMAPELVNYHLSNTPNHISLVHTDIYAFAMAMTTLAKWKPEPYLKLSNAEIYTKTLRGKHPKISSFYPKGIAKLIKLGFAQDPQIRPSMRVILQTLEKHAGYTVTTPLTSSDVIFIIRITANEINGGASLLKRFAMNAFDGRSKKSAPHCLDKI